MELTRLAAKQKRVQELKIFISEETSDPDLTKRFQDTVDRFSRLIAECWREKTVSEAKQLEFATVERELESLHEEARLMGGSKT